MFNGLFESYQYSIMCFIFAIGLFIVANRTMSTKYKQEIDKHFIVLIVLAILFALQDGVWGALAFGKYQPDDKIILKVWAYIWYISMALAGFVWTDYVIAYLGENYKHKDMIFMFRLFILIPQIVLLIINPWTDVVFYFDSNYNYVSGNLKVVIFALQFVYFASGIIFSSIQLMSTKEKTIKRQCLAAVLFSGIPLIGGLLMVFDNTMPFISAAGLLAILVLYIFNLNDLREESLASKYDEQIKLRNESLEIVRILSIDYISVYYVDLESKDMTIYRISEEVEKLFGPMLYKKVNFSQVLLYYLDKAILNEDKEALIPFADANYLSNLVKINPNYTKVYRVGDNVNFKYNQLRLIKASEDENGNVTSVILGIQNIDDVIHKEKDLQYQLETAKNAADSASNAKTSFLFNMSHDIRTPMNAIMGFTDMARKHIDDKDKVSDCLTKVKSSSEHLLSLINDVLDMSRIESGKVEREDHISDINKEMNKLINILNVNAKEKNIEINYNEDIKHNIVVMDSLHVERIMMNIISNSIKYTQVGGRIDISILEEQKGEDVLPFTITIEDNGMGMSKEFVAKIFEPFARAEGETVANIQGTGLGMAIVKNLVDILGGTIKIESELKKGTKTILHFEFVKANVEEEKEATREKKKINLKGKRLLLVEDNALNREIAKEILGEEGIIIEEAVDGEDAVEKITTKEASYYDYVLMDIQMPKMDGYTATSVIRESDDGKYKDLPIIAMTANAFAEDEKKAIEMGMNAHIAKPIDVEKLMNTLQSFV